MKRWIMGIAVLALVAGAGPVQAITLNDVIGLTRAEASNAVIMAQIEADGTVFHLTVAEILELKEAGVSDAVITFMINTGKQAPVMEEVEQIPQEQFVEEQPYDDTEYYEEDAGYYSTSLDAQYRTGSSVSVSFGIGFGFYYPYWPGFYWGAYYSPWGWWQPWRSYWAWGWPHYGWGWGGSGWGWGCGSCGVWRCSSYHNSYYAHNAGRYDGRNVGNRGSEGQPRVIKGGAAPYEAGKTANGRSTAAYQNRSPEPKMAYAQDSNNTQDKYGQPRVQPNGRGSSAEDPRSQRGVRVIRSTPTPTKQIRTSSSARGNRSVQSGPSKQKVGQSQPSARQNRSSRSPSREKGQLPDTQRQEQDGNGPPEFSNPVESTEVDPVEREEDLADQVLQIEKLEGE